jgi:hypothetical protein
MEYKLQLGSFLDKTKLKLVLHAAYSSINTLARFQKSPLPFRQATQPDRADPHSLETGNSQPDQLTHSAYLALASFSQYDSQLIAIDPIDLSRQQRLSIKLKPVSQESQPLVGQLPDDPHDVLLFDPALRPDDLLRQPSILSEEKQPLGIDIQTSGDRQVLQMFGA